GGTPGRVGDRIGQADASARLGQQGARRVRQKVGARRLAEDRGAAGMTQRSAIVRIDGKPVGTLTEQSRLVTFRYSREWLDTPGAMPVSLTLPLTHEPYTAEGLHPFFENLLPEGWLLELATTKLKLSKDDP